MDPCSYIVHIGGPSNGSCQCQLDPNDDLSLAKTAHRFTFCRVHGIIHRLLSFRHIILPNVIREPRNSRRFISRNFPASVCSGSSWSLLMIKGNRGIWSGIWFWLNPVIGTDGKPCGESTFLMASFCFRGPFICCWWLGWVVLAQ